MKLVDVNFAYCVYLHAKVAHCSVDRVDVLLTGRTAGQENLAEVSLARKRICGKF